MKIPLPEDMDRLRVNLCTILSFWRSFPCEDVQEATGDALWPVNHPQFCAGLAQSPVDLRDDTAVDMPTLNLAPLVFNQAYKEIPRRLVLLNYGDGVRLEPDDGLRRQIAGAGLQGAYVLHSIHLHFGTNSTAGSEHLLNGRRFATEMHFVHHRAEFTDLGQALQSRRRDALAVLGVFYDTTTVGPDLEDVMAGLRKDPALLREGNRVEVKPFSLMRLLPVNNLGDFFRYYGSLTTPTCNEIVAWTVFRTPVRIRQGAVDEIFNLMQTLGIISSERDRLLRSTQPLNGRVLLRSIPKK